MLVCVRCPRRLFDCVRGLVLCVAVFLCVCLMFDSLVVGLLVVCALHFVLYLLVLFGCDLVCCVCIYLFVVWVCFVFCCLFAAVMCKCGGLLYLCALVCCLWACFVFGRVFVGFVRLCFDVLVLCFGGLLIVRVLFLVLDLFV